MNPNPNQELWEKGDFTRIAAAMRESGDALVASLGITPGLKVLDLGSRDGTTALPAARRGADVLGVDIARNLVDAGNARARAEGLTNLRFEQGDATNLSGLADRSFDLVTASSARWSRRSRSTPQGNGARHWPPGRTLRATGSQRPDGRRVSFGRSARLFSPPPEGSSAR
jgi:SAM-dependent methyltransferase